MAGMALLAIFVGGVIFGYCVRGLQEVWRGTIRTRETMMTTTSNNFLESILMFALAVLIAALVFHLAGSELSAVANKVAESFQKASY